MKKNNYLKYFIIPLLCITLACPSFYLLAQPISSSTSEKKIVQDYITQTKLLYNQVKFLEQLSYDTIINKKDKTELNKQIKFTHANIESLQKNLNEYIKTIDTNSLESIYLTYLSIALSLLENSTKEINLYSNTDDVFTLTDSIQRLGGNMLIVLQLLTSLQADVSK